MTDASEAAVATDIPEAAVEDTGAPAPEVTEESPAAEQEKKDASAARFAALSRRAKQLREEQQRAKEELQRERDAFAKEREDFERKRSDRKDRDAKVAEYEQAIAERNPIAYLQKGGFSYEEATQFLLNDGKPSPEHLVKMVEERTQKLLEERTQGLQSKLDEFQKRHEEEAERRKAAEFERFVAQKRAEVSDLFSKNEREYSFSRALADQDEVLKVIGLAAQERDQDLSVKEAADLLEDFYVQQVKKVAAADKFVDLLVDVLSPEQLTKFQTTLQTKRGAKPANQAKPATDARAATASQTLTNNSVTSPATTEPPRKLTVEERREAAIRAMREAKALNARK